MILKIVIFAGLVGLFMITASGSPIPGTEMMDNEFIQKFETISKGNHSEDKLIQMRKILMFSMKPNNYLIF